MASKMVSRGYDRPVTLHKKGEKSATPGSANRTSLQKQTVRNGQAGRQASPRLPVLGAHQSREAVAPGRPWRVAPLARLPRRAPSARLQWACAIPL